MSAKKEVKHEHFNIDASRLFPDSLTESKLQDLKRSDAIELAHTTENLINDSVDAADEVLKEFLLPDISAEDKYRAMLGYELTDNGQKNPVLYREDFCGCCGTQHPKPNMLDMYPYCYFCFNTLREPFTLRKNFLHVEPKEALEILYATFGDPIFCQLSHVCTDVVRKLLARCKFKDRIQFKRSEDLAKTFGKDPNPDNSKQLRIRYRMNGVFGTVCLDVLPDNHLPENVMLICPKDRQLRITRANYGFPKGVSVDGRMSYDVTEIVQGLIDMKGGSYLNIGTQVSIKSFFGDPCPGYPKDLRLDYELTGSARTDVFDEDGRGYLKRRVLIETSPTVAPLILVQSAFYGITPTGRRDYIESLNREIRKCNAIQHKIDQGMIIRPEEHIYLKKKVFFVEEKSKIEKATISFVDCVKKLQILADKGGQVLKLDKKKFDTNVIFSNPAKGQTKLLEINLMCYGHDSERIADSKDMTASGFPRNYITSKTTRYVIPCRDDPATGSGIMDYDLNFFTDFSAPLIKVTKAIYGILSDMSKTIDVTAECQVLTQGRFLKISRHTDINQIFSDPCAGTRKQLKIQYTTLGFMGNLRVPVKDDFLLGKIELGYPPQAERDPAEDYM